MKLLSATDAVEVRLEAERAVLGDRSVGFRVHRRDGEIDAVEVDGSLFRVRSIRDGERVLVWCRGRVFEFRQGGSASSRGSEPPGSLISPMPGRVRSVLVGVGDRVTRGQVVLVLEAMKMEHAIRAPRDGRISQIACRQGELVDAGVPVAEIV